MNKRNLAIECIKSYLRKGDEKSALTIWTENNISVDVYRKLVRNFYNEI